MRYFLPAGVIHAYPPVLCLRDVYSLEYKSDMRIIGAASFAKAKCLLVFNVFFVARRQAATVRRVS